MLAMFLSIFRQTIVAAALPRIVGDLGGFDRPPCLRDRTVRHLITPANGARHGTTFGKQEQTQAVR